MTLDARPLALSRPSTKGAKRPLCSHHCSKVSHRPLTELPGVRALSYEIPRPQSKHRSRQGMGKHNNHCCSCTLTLKCTVRRGCMRDACSMSTVCTWPCASLPASLTCSAFTPAPGCIFSPASDSACALTTSGLGALTAHSHLFDQIAPTTRTDGGQRGRDDATTCFRI